MENDKLIDWSEVSGSQAAQIEDACKCGAESVIGGHGIRNGEVYSEYYCQTHYTQSKRS